MFDADPVRVERVNGNFRQVEKYKLGCWLTVCLCLPEGRRGTTTEEVNMLLGLLRATAGATVFTEGSEALSLMLRSFVVRFTFVILVATLYLYRFDSPGLVSLSIKSKYKIEYPGGGWRAVIMQTGQSQYFRWFSFEPVSTRPLDLTYRHGYSLVCL